MTTIKYSKAVLKYEDEDVYVELDARVLPANKDCDVSAVYSYDEWRTPRSKNGSFLKSLSADESLYRISIFVSNIPRNSRIWFALKLVDHKHRGDEHGVWDNNDSMNYEIIPEKLPQICLPSKDADKLPRSQSPPQNLTSPSTGPTDLLPQSHPQKTQKSSSRPSSRPSSPPSSKPSSPPSSRPSSRPPSPPTPQPPSSPNTQAQHVSPQSLRTQQSPTSPSRPSLSQYQYPSHTQISPVPQSITQPQLHHPQAKYVAQPQSQQTFPMLYQQPSPSYYTQQTSHLPQHRHSSSYSAPSPSPYPSTGIYSSLPQQKSHQSTRPQPQSCRPQAQYSAQFSLSRQVPSKSPTQVQAQAKTPQTTKSLSPQELYSLQYKFPRPEQRRPSPAPKPTPSRAIIPADIFPHHSICSMMQGHHRIYDEYIC